MPRDATRDVVRGLTSLEMTFVNISTLRWTLHSGYIGQITYADTIFLCFAFLSGMSPAPARRNVGLIGIGLSLQTVSAVVNRKPVVRIPGVLQRLGVASLIVNEPRLAFLRRYHGVPLMLLWYAITLLGASKTSIENPLAHPDYPAADARGIAQTRIDRMFFGQGLYTPSYDPEGLLGSLTTAVSMLVGQKIMASITMITVGETLHFLLPKYAPVSKSLWTPSFVLVTSGVSVLKYLALERAMPYLPTTLASDAGWYLKGNLREPAGRGSLQRKICSWCLTIVHNLVIYEWTGEGLIGLYSGQHGK